MTDQSEPALIPTPQPVRLPRFPARVAYAMIAINVLVFALDWLVGRRIAYAGALVPALVIVYGEWWRLITAGFLHANLTHIALNAYAVYGLGRLMERFFGPARFMIVYGLALLGSSVLVTLFSAFGTPTVGASGAIMGVLGALLVYFWHYRDWLVAGRSYLGELARMALINVGIGLLPGISWWGHLGGLLAGAAVGLALLPRYRYRLDLPAQLELSGLGSRDWLAVGLVAVVEIVLLGLALWTRVG